MFRKLAIVALALSFGASSMLWAATPVNINHANASQIAKSLDGIGKTRAQAIVNWRGAHGPFKNVDDLRHVKGVGKATIERNRSAILLTDDTATMPAATAKAKPESKKHAAQK
ncbi:MAG: helix-hairpin-helix domain-containing protein [Rhodanobacter sp.]